MSMNQMIVHKGDGAKCTSKEGVVQCAVQVLGDEVETLQKEVAELASLLTPVLAPEQTGPCDKPDSPPDCIPLAGQICGIGLKVQAANATLRSLRARVGL